MPFDFLKPFYVAQRFQVLTPNGWSINIDMPKSDYSETKHTIKYTHISRLYFTLTMAQSEIQTTNKKLNK